MTSFQYSTSIRITSYKHTNTAYHIVESFIIISLYSSLQTMESNPLFPKRTRPSARGPEARLGSAPAWSRILRHLDDSVVAAAWRGVRPHASWQLMWQSWSLFKRSSRSSALSHKAAWNGGSGRLVLFILREYTRILELFSLYFEVYITTAG